MGPVGETLVYLPLFLHDPGERRNLAATQPAKVAELKAVISAFTNSVAAEQTFWGPP